MAVDYFHRIIVSGPARDVRSLRAGLVTDYSREVEGEVYIYRLPFSFAGLFSLAPAARRCEPEEPLEPYDIRVWPIVRRSANHLEVRYQLHTRNAELVSFLRVLSRSFKRVTFRLATLYLDDTEFVGFLVRSGRVQRWRLPESRRDFHWDRAREKFNLAGDDVYDDDAAELFAEDAMQEDALNHWQPPQRTLRTRSRNWWNRPAVRDFMEQRQLDLIEVSEAAAEFDREERRQRRRRKRGMTSAAAAAGAPPARPPHVVEQTREKLDAEARFKRRRKEPR